jgi:hypothetical protein
MQDSDKTKAILTALIQKQMLILGPNVALGRARRVQGLTVMDDGSVADMKGDADETSKALVNEFIALTGDITRTIFDALIKNS